jgi:hypothetical protein
MNQINLNVFGSAFFEKAGKKPLDGLDNGRVLVQHAHALVRDRLIDLFAPHMVRIAFFVGAARRFLQVNVQRALAVNGRLAANFVGGFGGRAAGRRGLDRNIVRATLFTTLGMHRGHFEFSDGGRFGRHFLYNIFIYTL